MITPVDDSVDDDDETLKVLFGTLPENLSPGTTTETVVTIVDNDDPQVEVNFRRAIHDVAEGADRTVTVNLTADPERTVVIPLTATGQDGATSADYSVPDSVTFESGETTKDVTFTATQDAIDDDGEKVLLEFGTLPDGVTPGTVPTSTVSIIDDDAPASVAVSWAQDTYTVAEGGSVTVTAELDDDPEKTVVVPIARTDQGGASSGDYSGVPVTITFESGDTSKSFTFTATDDAQDDDDESVQLTFGPTLPSGSNPGDAGQHGGENHRRRRPAGERQLRPRRIYRRRGRLRNRHRRARRRPGADGGHTGHAHSQGRGDQRRLLRSLPESVTFDSGDTEKTFTFSATDDTVDDDDEEVLLGFGTLPSDVSAGTVKETVVRITDDDLPASLTVNFGADRYTVAEGSTVEVTVTLDEDPERTVVIPLARENLGGTSDSDYSGVPESVTFGSGDTSRTFTVAAVDDKLRDSGEELKLTFGTLPPGRVRGIPQGGPGHHHRFPGPGGAHRRFRVGRYYGGRGRHRPSDRVAQ